MVDAAGSVVNRYQYDAFGNTVEAVEKVNNFSPADKNAARAYNAPIYVATPNGALKKYDPSTNTVSVLSNSMPKDPNAVP